MTARFIVADVFDGLAQLEDGSVDLVVTSPPFLALRSYLPADHPDKDKEIGSEATPAEFLDTLLAVTAELRRVLAPHGSIAVELGDTYAGSGGSGGDYNAEGLRAGQPRFRQGYIRRNADGSPAQSVGDTESYGPDEVWATQDKGGDGWPLPKSVCMIPEAYRFALAYGFNPFTGAPSPAGKWRVRNKVTWCRPNPPVGALGDKWRPATSDVVVACVSPKRYWDDLATRRPVDPQTPRNTNGPKSSNSDRSEVLVGFDVRIDSNPSGAPLLDYWEIPPGGYNGKTLTVHREPCGPDDGGERITSPDCPEHGDQTDQAPTAPGGGRGGTSQTRTSRTDGHPVQGQLTDSAPTDLPGGPATEEQSSGSTPHVGDPTATQHDKGSSKKARAPETNQPGKPSAQTDGHTDGTPTSPLLSEPHPDNPESNTSADGSSDSPAIQSPGRTADSDTEPALSEACSCSWSKIVKEEYTSHYAVFPPALVEPLVKAMGPQKVCQTCGEPSRRIVKQENHTDDRQALADHMREQRETLGITRAEFVPHFPHYKNGESVMAQVSNWELAKNVPSATDWPILVDLLDLSDEFAHLIEGTRQWTESLVEYEHINDHPSGTTQDATGRVYNRLPARKNRIEPDAGWTDCGHDNYRPGIVLDPFAGSGTTLAVATGHGLDAIGIDIDERNHELTTERVGPFLMEMTE